VSSVVSNVGSAETLSARLDELSSGQGRLRVFGWAGVVGVLAGVIGAAFRLGASTIFEFLLRLYASTHANPFAWIVPVTCTAALAWVSVFLVRRFVREASGSGVQEIEGALEGVRPLRWQRVLPIKFVGGLCSLGAGMVLGREGPTIQLGGNFGKMIADLRGLPTATTRTLVAAGAGAGLTTAFNAPLAGILFVIEEMRPQFEYNFTSMQAVVIACAVADIVVRALTGQGPVLPITTFPSPTLEALWFFPLLGVVFGTLGLVFNRGLILSLDFFADLNGWQQWAGVLAVGAVVGWLAWAYPAAVGGGDALIPQLLRTSMTPLAIAVLFVTRFGATMISYGCGAPGGIFAPMLALGTLVGLWFGHYAHAWFPGFVVHPGTFAVAGMGGLFTATVRAPITGIALAIELTADYQQVLPLLLVCGTATIVAEFLGGKPIYSVLLQRTLQREAAQQPHS
jgi:chloride channel protein, CIC family